ncbi:MAG: hypothetical protein ACKO3K_06745 [Cuspidothrix sp.]
MRKTIVLGVLSTVSTMLSLVPLSPLVFAQETVTNLTYEFNQGNEAYLNVCSLNYRLPSNRCAKVNVVNRKIEGKRGLTQLSSRQLRPGDRVWSVMVINVNGRECLISGEIEGGKTFNYSGC